MMKRKCMAITLCLAAALMLQACGGSSEQETTEPKPYEVTESLEDGGNKVLYYDENDILREEEFYRPDSTMDCRLSYNYDDEGRVVKERYYYPDNEQAMYFLIYEYDTGGRLVRKIHTNAFEMPVITWDYQEDGTSKMTDQQTIYNGYSSEKYTVVTHCDENGVKQYANIHSQGEHLAHLEYNPDGSGIMWRYETIDEAYIGQVKYERHFDARDQLVKEIYYYIENGQVFQTTVGVFDESGTLTGKVTTAECDGITTRQEKTPDGLVLLHEEYDEKGVLLLAEKRQFNEAGLETRCECYDGNGVLTGYIVYEYDENNEFLRAGHYLGDGTLEYYTT